MKKILLSLMAAVTVASAYAQVQRQVLIEEFTGTWCPNCPDGHSILKTLETANPGKVNVVGMHNNDAYTIPYEQAMESAFQVGGYPRAGVDRATYASGNAFVMSRNHWAGATTARLNIASPVSLDIVPTYDPATRSLEVKVDYTFTSAYNEATRLTCVLVEDSIIAAQSGSSNPNYVHMDVCRALLSSENWGDDNHGATVTAGSSFSKTYTYTVPAGFNDKHLRVIAFINEKVGTSPVLSTGTEVLNSGQAKVVFYPTAINEVKETINFNVSPNPFQDLTSISFNLKNDAKVKVFITNVSGQIVANLADEKRNAGDHTFYWSGANNNFASVNAGMYFFNVAIDGQLYGKPVIFKP